MKKYKKIEKYNVEEILTEITLDIFSPGIINIVEIAGILKTSRYQVKKYIDELKKENMIKLEYIIFNHEDFSENTLPYCGYCLTDKFKQTEYYKKRKEENIELLNECFKIS